MVFVQQVDVHSRKLFKSVSEMEKRQRSLEFVSEGVSSFCLRADAESLI